MGDREQMEDGPGLRLYDSAIVPAGELALSRRLDGSERDGRNVSAKIMCLQEPHYIRLLNCQCVLAYTREDNLCFEADEKYIPCLL